MLHHLVNQRMGSGYIHWKMLSFLDLLHCITIREEANQCSTNQIVKMLDAIAKLKGIPPSAFRPLQLPQKIGELERTKLLRVDMVMVYAEIDNKRSKSCVFYYIP